MKSRDVHCGGSGEGISEACGYNETKEKMLFLDSYIATACYVLAYNMYIIMCNKNQSEPSSCMTTTSRAEPFLIAATTLELSHW